MNQMSVSNLINILPFLFLISFIIIKSIGIFLSIIAILIINEFKSEVKNYRKIDYAIVLGAGLDGAEVSTRLKKRLDAADHVLNNMEVPIIVSGGQGPDELVTEAYAMSEYLIEKGIKRERLILEDQSTSTQENLLFSSKYIEKRKNNLLIITSDYHMFRAKMLGKRLGYKVQGISAKSSREELPKQFLREIFAVLKDLVVRKY
jgi:uncharacterized SAM-binding protein YcdF (DUF218 family)